MRVVAPVKKEERLVGGELVLDVTFVPSGTEGFTETKAAPAAAPAAPPAAAAAPPVSP